MFSSAYVARAILTIPQSSAKKKEKDAPQVVVAPIPSDSDPPPSDDGRDKYWGLENVRRDRS